MVHFGDDIEAVLRRLSVVGPLFPYFQTVCCGDRATEFKQRCEGLGIKGVSLHSYRYAWAERAKQCGYPERFAQEALGQRVGSHMCPERITIGYALFQTANNTAVMTDIRPDQRGVISGLLNLSRNLGLVTGASVMGAVFAVASATTNLTTANPEAIATGMRITFAVALFLIVIALAIAVGSRALATRLSLLGDVS